MSRGERLKLFWGLLFISPWLAGFAVFTLYPLAASFYYSFCDYDILSEPLWVGTANYAEMLEDELFWKSLYNTCFFAALFVPFGLLFSLLVAMLLNQAVKLRFLFRTLFYLPALVPIVAGAMIWLWIYNGEYGLLNHALSQIGIRAPQWLADPAWIKPALVLMAVWGVGNTIIIYLAALQDVPVQLYESAEIDGAGFWGKFRHITIPMVSPVIYFNLVMGIIGSMQIFTRPYIMMERGGPDDSALFYTIYIFQNAFKYSRMGYASAMAWVLFLVIVVLTWLGAKAMRTRVYYEGR